MAESDNLTQELIDELKKDRKSRRRKFWFKFILFGIIGLIVIGAMFGKKEAALFKPHVGLVKIKGVIGDGEDVEAESVIEALKVALDNNLSAGLILEINSPGGSPAQSALIYDEITALRSEYPKKKFIAW